MLLNHFYTLQKQEFEGNRVKAFISFNASHKIFDGHFPGHPVVPGVCMMQILREIMEIQIKHKLRITAGDNMKFLAIINPEVYKEVEVSIMFTEGESSMAVTASILSGDLIFFKFKGQFTRV